MPGFSDLAAYYAAQGSGESAAPAPSTATTVSPVVASSSQALDPAAVISPSTSTSIDSDLKKALEAGFNPVSFWGPQQMPYVSPEYADEFLRWIGGEEAVSQSYRPFTRFGDPRIYALPGQQDYGVRRNITQPGEALRIPGGAGLPYGSLTFNPTNDLGSNNFFADFQDPESGVSMWLRTVGSVLGAAVLPGVTQGLSESMGGGMLGNVAAGAAVGAGRSALQGGNPVVGAVTGGLSGGFAPTGSAGDAAGGSAFDTYNSDIQYADTADLQYAADGAKRTAGMFSGSESIPADFFAPAAEDQSGAYLRSAMGPTASQVPGMPVASALPGGMLGSGYDRVTGVPYDIATGMATGSAVPAQFDGTLESLLGVTAPADAQPSPERQQPKAKEPSLLDTAGKALKIGSMLSEMNAGQNVPADAPQRAEGQSDADYSALLANYIQVDAQALADMGLAPGTPEYYDYLMSQLDATVENMTQGLDVNAADLEQQLRGKTQAELLALQRALYVRGQLGQLMGSGTYTDPFTGQAEDVITNGQLVNPGVAAYHRGLGRTIGDFAQRAPVERNQAIGDFLGRDADIYGMQARADARAEQEARAQAVMEDMKRRRGMFNDFSSGMVGDPQLDAIFGANYDQDAALRAIFGQ